MSTYSGWNNLLPRLFHDNTGFRLHDKLEYPGLYSSRTRKDLPQKQNPPFPDNCRLIASQ